MALVSIKEFAKKKQWKVSKVYELLRNQPHLKKKIKGLGTLVDETKYQRLIAS